MERDYPHALLSSRVLTLSLKLLSSLPSYNIRNGELTRRFGSDIESDYEIVIHQAQLAVFSLRLDFKAYIPRIR